MIKPRSPLPSKLLAAGIASVLSLGLLAGTARADDEDLIKYRQAVMSAIAAHSKAIDLTLKGKVPREADLGAHAAAIASLSGTVADLFPEGSDFGETDAKAEIWENKDDFLAKAQDLLNAADSLTVSPDAEHYGRLRDTCKACHKKYKAD